MTSRSCPILREIESLNTFDTISAMHMLEMLENDKSNDKYILSKQIPSTWGLSKANKYLLQGKDH